jgi:uncharacterized membrane protein
MAKTYRSCKWKNRDHNGQETVLLFTASVSFGHCALCLSIYSFCIFWPLWSLSFYLQLLYLLAIVISVFLFTASVSFGHCHLCPSIYSFCIFWSLWSLSFYLQLLYLLAIVISVLLFTASVSFGHCDLCLSILTEITMAKRYRSCK